MNKKSIVQIVIIVVAFLGAGFVLYNGFFKGSAKPAYEQSLGPVPAGGQQQTSQQILPYGPTLNFDILNKQNLGYNYATYPQLDSKSDIGIPESSLVTSPPASATK